MQGNVPEALERDGAGLGLNLVLPALLEESEIGLGQRASKLGQAVQEDVLALARVVERGHDRLLQGQRVLAGFEIVPALQPVVDGQNQVARGSRLVGQQAQPNAQGHLGHGGTPGAVSVVGRGQVVGGIDVPEQRGSDAACRHVVDQLLEVGGRGQRGRVQLREHGLAFGPEHAVQQVAGSVRLGRGRRAGQHQGFVAGGAQVLHQGVELGGKRLGLGQLVEREGVEGRGLQPGRQGAIALEMNRAQKPEGDARESGRTHGHAHVGLAAGQAHSPLHDVEAVHGAGRRSRAAHAGEAGDGGYGVAEGSQKIGLQGKNDLRLTESIPRQSDIAEERLLGRAGGLVGGGLPLDVAQAGQRLGELRQHCLSAGRKQRRRDQRDGLARGLFQATRQLCEGLLPGAGAPIRHGAAQAVGVVQTQQIRGRMKTGLALVQRVLVVALDMDGAALACLDQHRIGDLALLKGAGVVVRDAGNDLFLFLGVGHDGRAIFRQPAPCARGQGRGRSEQGQKPPTGNAVAIAIGGLAAGGEHWKLDGGPAFIHGVSRLRGLA